MLGVIVVMGAHKSFKIKMQSEDKAVVVVQRRRVSRFIRSLRLG